MKKSGILFLGDTYLPRSYSVELPEDISFIINLEAPITKRGRPIPEKVNLVCREDYIKETFNILPLAVCLANNHIMDYGEEGFTDTLELLRKQNILFFGVGTANDNFNNPLIIRYGGTRLGLFGYCYQKHIAEVERAGLKCGPAPLDYNKIINDIETHQNNTDKIIVNLHWGVEESNIPEAKQVTIARNLIDAGVDCIISHHSHVIQPVEKYKNGIIAYGLGNFIFDTLNAPGCFDTNGKPEKYYFKKQRKWNRSSIGIYIEFDKMSYSIKNYYFDGVRVISKKNNYHRYAHYSIPNNLGELQSRANKHHKKAKILLAFYRYFDKPKIPSLKGIINIIKLFLTKTK